jgi:hypothetical protein
MKASALSIQTANICCLEMITCTTNRAKVEAFPGPAATQNCANDSAHGKGICYDEFADGLCLACEIEAIEARIAPGELITVEVRA